MVINHYLYNKQNLLKRIYFEVHVMLAGRMAHVRVRGKSLALTIIL